MLSLLILAAVVTLYVGCSKDDPAGKSDEDQQIELLNGTWLATSVELDNVPQEGYENFQLTISGSAGNSTISYTTANRPETSAWPASGTFTFGENVLQTLLRSEGDDPATEINYGVEGDILQLQFVYSGEPITSGRVKNVQGTWEFVFERQ